MSEDEYSYSCMVYNKGDQEDSENMDPVSTDLFGSLCKKPSQNTLPVLMFGLTINRVTSLEQLSVAEFSGE